MRVLLVSNTFPPADISGVGTLVAELLAQLNAGGHEAMALVRAAGPAPGVMAVGGAKLLFPLHAALGVRRAGGGRPFDVVHVPRPAAGTEALLGPQEHCGRGPSGRRGGHCCDDIGQHEGA